MDPTHQQLKNLDPTQPMSQPDPWTTLLHSPIIIIFSRSVAFTYTVKVALSRKRYKRETYYSSHNPEAI